MRIERHTIWPPIALACLVLLVVAIGIMEASRVYKSSETPVKLSATAADLPAKPGTDKTIHEKKQHSVPADHPRQLQIEKLGIDANILPMGLLQDGALDAPKTAWDIGWYDQSAKPGSNQDALLLDGHVNNTLGTPGVFYELHSLEPGDKIKIERGDSSLYSYRVVSVEQQPVAEVDMSKMMKSITPGRQGLNIITCGGEYDHASKTFKNRVLVFAEQID